MEQQIIMPTGNSLLDKMKNNDYLQNNTIYLDVEIDRDSQVLFCRQLRKLEERELAKPTNDRKPIIVRISSFGGWVCAVFAMISEMERIQENGIEIHTYCDGYTASGGSKILMAGTKGHRYISRYGTVLIHQSNSYKMGRSTLAEDIREVEESLKDWETLKCIFRKHTKLTEDDIENYTKTNLDYTYRPNECLEKGIVDHIL